MPFIERGRDSKIIGLYNVAQPGRADNEVLAEDDPEVIAFRTKDIGKAALSTEEIWDVLIKNNLVDPVTDRPRPKPQDARP